MENTKKDNKKVILAVGILVVMVAALAIVYAAFGAKPVAGSKAITIEVINKAGESEVYQLTTNAEFLQQAMEEAEGLNFSGEETQYGLTIDTVNGERADYTLDKAYWSFCVNGTYCNYGISSQPVMDGDAFQIIYTPAE